MGVKCEILIIKPSVGYHKAGSSVRGTVKYVVDVDTEYKHVTLSLIGKGKCEWDEDKTTYTGKETYITQHIDITNKNPGKTIHLHGVYEYPFEFYLPEDIPSSHKDKHSSITYRIRLKFVKASIFSFNKVFTVKIPVCGLVNLQPGAIQDGPVIFGLNKCLTNLFTPKGSKVNLKAEIAKTCLSPGENIHLSYTLSNNTDIATSIKTELYCRTTYKSDCKSTKKVETKVKECKAETLNIPKEKAVELSCVLPTLPQLYSIQFSRVVTREYHVRVTVGLPMPHANAMVEMPVVIGERTTDPVAALEDADSQAPPSYWETMCEDKNEKEEKA